MENDKVEVTQAEAEEQAAMEARREVLKKMGIYAAVSTPILVGALKSDRAVAASPIGPGIPGGGGTGGGGTTVF